MPYTNGQTAGTGTAGTGTAAQPQVAVPGQALYPLIAQQQAQGGGSLAGELGGAAAPSLAQTGLSMQDILNQLGLVTPGLNEQLAGQNLNAQYGLEQLGIGGEQIGLSQQDNAAQQALLGLETGLQRQEYGISSTQFPEQYAQAALQNKLAVRGLSEQQAQSGVQGSAGQEQAVQAQSQQYGWQQQDIARNQQLAQLSQQGTEGQQNYDVGALARAKQNLGLAAQANGISEQQLLSQWQQGLAQTGNQALGSIDQLYSQYLSGAGQGASTLGGILGQAVLFGDLGGVSTLFGGTG